MDAIGKSPLAIRPFVTSLGLPPDAEMSLIVAIADENYLDLSPSLALDSAAKLRLNDHRGRPCSHDLGKTETWSVAQQPSLDEPTRSTDTAAFRERTSDRQSGNLS